MHKNYGSVNESQFQLLKLEVILANNRYLVHIYLVPHYTEMRMKGSKGAEKFIS